MRKIIGDLSNTERVLVGLQLRPGELKLSYTQDGPHARTSTSSERRRFWEPIAGGQRLEYVLRLYVAGMSSRRSPQ